jgi:hypothetical protein
MTKKQKHKLYKDRDWYDPEYKPISKPDNFEPDLNFPLDHKCYGHIRCLQWSGRLGRQCLNIAIKGSNKCRHHGGKKATGVANGNFKHGRYTKAVAGNPSVAKAYDIALKQQGLLNLSPNIAMTDARLDLLYQEDIYLSDEIIDAVETLYNAWQELKQDIPKNDPKITENMLTVNAQLLAILRMMKSRKAFDKREDTLTERRRKLTETETKRQLGTAEVVLKAEVISIFATMGTAFRELIVSNIEGKQRSKILSGFSEIIDTYIIGFFGTEEEKRD